MSETTKAYAAKEAGAKFELFEFEAGELENEQVEIAVDYCGICHSDLSMRNNEWMMTEYPFVGGHEVVGKITAMGDGVKGLEIGDTVGLGWNSASCGHCDNCISGFQINCPNIEGTIVQHYGGFADKVRCNWDWAVKLPDAMDASKVGRMFCGGITVFNPFVQSDIKPTDKVGVIGIGGLGHLALQFADKWGCEVTAFTSDLSKTGKLKAMHADFVVNSRDDAEIEKLAGKFDMILSTVNVPLNWKAYLTALAPKGKLHLVGAVLEPIPVGAFDLIMNQKAITGTATGSPIVVRDMIDFCARHGIETVTENYKMSNINENTGKNKWKCEICEIFCIIRVIRK